MQNKYISDCKDGYYRIGKHTLALLVNRSDGDVELTLFDSDDYYEIDGLIWETKRDEFGMSISTVEDLRKTWYIDLGDYLGDDLDY